MSRSQRLSLPDNVPAAARLRYAVEDAGDACCGSASSLTQSDLRQADFNLPPSLHVRASTVQTPPVLPTTNTQNQRHIRAAAIAPVAVFDCTYRSHQTPDPCISRLRRIPVLSCLVTVASAGCFPSPAAETFVPALPTSAIRVCVAGILDYHPALARRLFQAYLIIVSASSRAASPLSSVQHLHALQPPEYHLLAAVTTCE